MYGQLTNHERRQIQTKLDNLTPEGKEEFKKLINDLAEKEQGGTQ